MSGRDFWRAVDAIVFDLDGTLADTFADLRTAVNHVRGLHGLAPLPLSDVMDNVGHGASALLAGTLGPLAPGDRAADLAAFRGFYSAHLLDETKPFPGAIEAVVGLAGRRRAVLSNKPEAMTRAIVEAFGLAPHLVGAWGGDSFPTMKPDPAPLLAVLDRLGVAPGRAMMVGDSDVDIETAARAGVRSVRVRTGLWRASLLVPGAEVEDLRELAERLDSALPR